ncbi:hypothetical protein L226DRAFT_326610 [Lentinus tigrinus ALCF2SS1-7]|uniref:Uncharacterized protein n=1 Tax=Lentinus tigrinus ALCF2SS1-6 TaxID=1328759 RepID=A0A5C2SHQ9_9APHY|nr:hypothetical protein L227DRAFT_432281 [Lentinus tigrinus ALCF2SS1-6]RPD77591.1 hypothetical protein L226DRAFT_326610 [Lentinus tigrinus ALCF2SS1-7]
MYATMEFSMGLGGPSSCSEARWVRKWIKRQQAKTRRRKSDGSNSGSAEGDSAFSPFPSTEEREAATVPLPVPLPPVATDIPPPQEPIPADTPACSARAPVPLVFPAQPDALYHSDVTAVRPAAIRPAFQQLSGPCSPGVDSGACDGYSSGVAYTSIPGPSSTAMHLPPTSLVDHRTAQPGLPAALFSVPLCLDTPPLYTVTPPFGQGAPQDFTQDHINPAYTRTTADFTSSIELPPVADFPGASTTVAPAALSIPSFVPPIGLTAGAAYLYKIFHSPMEANEAAPPEAPPFNSEFFLPELARPSDMSLDLRLPLSAFSPPVLPVSYHGYSGAAYPLSYQMRLSDLVALTKAIRLAAMPAASDDTKTPVQDTDVAMGTGEGGNTGHAGKSYTHPTK